MSIKAQLCLSASMMIAICAGTVAKAANPAAGDRLPATVADWARGAQLFDGLGNRHRAITTSSLEAQQYFDQGLRLMWAFNHDEATRSFAKAAELDPLCASCFWGVSLTLGPNYNLPFMTESRAKIAFYALQQAEKTAARCSPVERALIAALAERYPGERPLDAMSVVPVLTAYARAMQRVAASFPQDLDVQTLYAESMMNVHAWKLWTQDGKPGPGTREIVATLESVLTRDPMHPGANHYLVHALEASPHPEDGLAAAERLQTLMPAAGHLLHMPAHILQRLGRYEEAAEANRRGAAADEAYEARTRPLDYYPVVYTAHNYQFLAYSAAMGGRRAETIAAVDHSRQIASDGMLLEIPGTDWYVAESYSARVRFGLWKQLLALPPPNPKLAGLTAGYLYGRAVALVASRRPRAARSTLRQMRKLARTVPVDAPAGQNTIRAVLAIAIPIVEARIAAVEGHASDAEALLRQAVVAEDRLAYDEPNDWLVPARELLGAQLLRSGKASEAEAVYREDLRRFPANGWSLCGLSAALRAQGKKSEARPVDRLFARAWSHADIRLTASAF